MTTTLKSKLAKQAKRNSHPHLIVMARAGCLAADTVLNINRAGKGSRMSIEKVVKQFSGEGFSFMREGKYPQRSRPWNLTIPTKIARAEGSVVKLATLKNAWFSGMKNTFVVTTETGRSIRATSIHPFLTEDGTWKPLSNLQVGDSLRVNIGRSTKGKSAKKSQYPNVQTKFHPNQVNNGDGRYKVPLHRAIIEADMNGIPFNEFILILREDEETSSCLSYLSLNDIVHHKNEDTFDYRLENLEVINHQEHATKHKWGDNVLWQIGFETIESIEYHGEEPTYDIEVEDDPHNFLANGFVVHNTGKTTTLVEGLKVLKGEESAFTPSPQQEEIWKSMGLSKDAKSICFVAFNKSIATELQQRVPEGCEAMTLHSMGLKAVTKAYGKLKVNSYRTQDLLEKVTGRSIREMRRRYPTEVKATETLVGLCKVNLLEGTEEDLDYLTSYYEVETNGSRDKIYSYVPKILELAADPQKDGCIDFNDMIWLPVHNKLSTFHYDLLMVDEAQDLNKCQQALALKCGRRLIFVGDDKQAIYGFAGADSQSLPNLQKELGEVQVLPLTVTRRCGKAIVEEAKRYVPDFEAWETNGEGSIKSMTYDCAGGGGPERNGSYHSSVLDGDMILCRVNAPLVQQCFKFLKAGRKANIQGRDVGRGLISTIKKTKANDIVDLGTKLEEWFHFETKKENVKKNPSETKLMSLQDRYDCLTTFCDGKTTVEEIITSIESVFTDDRTDGILLSSVHKSKGLEAKRVFLLEPKGATIPHPMAKSEWQIEQEMNIKYVAITRAIEELVFVS